MGKRAGRESFSFDETGDGAGTDKASVSARQLRLVASPGRPLTKAQKKFDRLLRKVESLRAERAKATARWNAFVKIYQERIHPEERRMSERRKQVVLLLAAHWRKPKGLGKRQREQLEAFLEGQLRSLADAGPEWIDGELRALWDELRASAADGGGGDATHGGADGNAAAGEGAGADQAAMPPELRELIDRLGLDPKAFHSRMSPGEIVAEIERQMAAGPDGAPIFNEAEERAGAAVCVIGTRARSARQEAAERKAAERAAAREEARKRTVVSIYKQLAKVLHPDLEQDPAMRERKHTLMQELTKAYREGDLHTLLRLELAWLKREEGDLERLGDEQVGIYCELLEEQVEELQAEIREVPYAPRFSAVARFARPFGQGPRDVESILLSIRGQSDALRRFRDDLGGPRSQEVVRALLRDVGEQMRRAERWGDIVG